MTALLWIASGLCLLFWLLTAFTNAAMAWLVLFRRGPENHSFIPVLGGLAGAVGVLLAPIGGVSARLLVVPVPLIFDVGCVPLLVFFLLTRHRSGRPPAA